MKPEKQTRRLGLAVVIFALILRLAADGPLAEAVAAVSSPEWISFALFLETGRLYRPVLPEEATVAETVEQTLPPEQSLPPEQTMPPEENAVAVFSPEDASLVQVNSVCGYIADVPALLEKSLDWDLTAAEPTVLILSAHATESYENTEGYKASAAYRTLDTAYNMISVGPHLAQLLEAKGIRVIPFAAFGGKGHPGDPRYDPARLPFLYRCLQPVPGNGKSLAGEISVYPAGAGPAPGQCGK